MITTKVDTFSVRLVYTVFTLIWVLLVVLNGFATNFLAIVLLIPIFLFMIGFINADFFNDNLETDVFNITFINAGLLLSLPLLKVINDKNNHHNKKLTHAIFLSMICVLLSYYHIWIKEENRFICRTIQSCLETFAITLYIYTLVVFFNNS